MLLARTIIAFSVFVWTAQASSIERRLRRKKGKSKSYKKCPYKSKSSKKSKNSSIGVEGELYEGMKIPFGDGLMWSFVEWDDDGSPSRVGMKFKISSFASLPTAPSEGLWDIRDASGTTVLAQAGHEYIPYFPVFPEKAAEKLKFKHIVTNWNPFGHGPPGVYNVPHFDMHFYLISNKERNGCVLAPLDTEVCPTASVTAFKCPPGGPPTLGVDCAGANFLLEPLPDDMYPAGYAVVCAAEPGMGDHMIRPAAPEFNGKAFTHTWIWGHQGGEISFFEPMITSTFLDTVRDNHGVTGWYDAATYLGKEVSTTEGDGIMVPISGLETAKGDPIALAEAGYYPTSYRVLYNDADATFTVDLIDFEGFCATDYPSDLVCPDYVQKVAADDSSSSSGKKRSRKRKASRA